MGSIVFFKYCVLQLHDEQMLMMMMIMAFPRYCGHVAPIAGERVPGIEHPGETLPRYRGIASPITWETILQFLGNAGF